MDDKVYIVTIEPGTADYSIIGVFKDIDLAKTFIFNYKAEMVDAMDVEVQIEVWDVINDKFDFYKEEVKQVFNTPEALKIFKG